VESGVIGKAQPPEAENNLKTKWAILRRGFDYLVLSDISSIDAYLLYLYNNAKLYKEFIEVMFWGWIIHVWSYLWHLGGLAPKPPCPRLFSYGA